MKKFTDPLNNISIASPCSANWDEMIGDNCKRFCGECKLNVYNLSGMTKNEAENLLLNSEGKLCLRFYRRNDGTILTKDCPVGWQAIKRRVSKISAAVFSMIAGIFAGIYAFNKISPLEMTDTMGTNVSVRPTVKDISNVNLQEKPETNYIMGSVATTGTPLNINGVRNQIKKNYSK